MRGSNSRPTACKADALTNCANRPQLCSGLSKAQKLYSKLFLLASLKINFSINLPSCIWNTDLFRTDF